MLSNWTGLMVSAYSYEGTEEIRKPINTLKLLLDFLISQNKFFDIEEKYRDDKIVTDVILSETQKFNRICLNMLRTKFSFKCLEALKLIP